MATDVTGECMMNTLAHVERIVRRGGLLMAESLDHYWPSNGNNEVPEANIVLSISQAFRDAGYYTYAEVHSGESTSKRIDLVAIEFDKSVQVAVEAKRLYSSQQAESMFADMKRVRDFSLSPHGMLRSPAPTNRFGLLVATTWSAEYARWFSFNSADNPRGLVWDKLIDPQMIDQSNVRWGSVAIRAMDSRRRNDDGLIHYFVYCLFSV